jgi:glycosyltransferase involved in cell wall biosynthesis
VAVARDRTPARSQRSDRRRESGLQFGLDYPLPRTVAVGAGTALFVCGWCFSGRARMRSLDFVIDGRPQPVMLHGMPRIDVLRALEPAGTESYTSYRSGFWGIVRVEPWDGDRDRELLLHARLEDGSEELVELARITTTTRTEQPIRVPVSAPSTGPFVAIAMATYEPAIDLFRRQVDSIRAQSHDNWVCVISDDCSSPARFEAMREVIGDDSRFVLTRSRRRLRFYHNFERALALTPPEAEYVAMADQDDYWYPDKLEALLLEVGDAQLVYSDARIVRADGELVSDTYWSVRRNNHSDVASLLMANCVTGAASLCRRDLIDYALPFPPRQFTHFHDHWVALMALALGEIAFVDRPLYDYVQHGEAVLGHAKANRITALGGRLESLRRLHERPRERVGRWRMRFFVDCCRLMQFGTVLEMRCGDQMEPAKRRAIERFMRAERSPLALWNFGRRAAREMIGPPETVGAELGLLLAFAWRHMTVASIKGRERPRSRLRIDARPPPSLLPTPGKQMPATPVIGEIAAKIAPLELTLVDEGPRRINLLIPTIDLDHFFGGYIGKLNLASRLADRGLRVRIVTVDPVGPLPPSWPRTLEAYSGLAGLFDRVEVVFGRESPGLEVSRGDRFIATTWWTAHIAREAVAQVGGERFLYLIQEYEPFTFPMGTYAALASESYRFPHFALFSTELLRDYFRRRGIGVYRDGTPPGDEASAAFQNAITPVVRPSARELAGRRTRRLLFYARPEPHASRNLFELGMLALDRATDEGTLGQGWELHGIGSVNSQRRMTLASGAVLELVPRLGQEAYARMLRDHDIGLALMYTPHPSLVPIEMASAAMLTVTNSFENKTPEAMTAISSNMITVEPTVDQLVVGLREAARRVDDFEGRARGSEVRWCRDWRQSFDDELMTRIESMLQE